MVKRRSDIAAQLRERLVAELHLGIRRHGDRMPSTRDLAQELHADPRVVVAAYRELEKDGLVEFRPRSGVYVAESALTVRSSLPRVAAWALDIFVDGLSRGVPAPELSDRLRRCLETLRLHATCIECNLDQLHSLCHELHRDYGLETTALDLDALNTDGEDALPLLRRTDILVTTSFHAAEVKRIAERVGKPWFAITIGSELISEITRMLRDGAVYIVGTDERLRAKMQMIFQRVPGSENLHVVIVGQDDLGTIPSDAPTYIMKRVRDVPGDVLGTLPKLAHLHPMDRVFAPESARDLLGFILHANTTAMAAQTAGMSSSVLSA